MGKGRIAVLVVALLATLLLLVSVDTRSAFAQELSLDDVTIQSFKIIDTTHGDAEIEHSLSSEASPKTDPSAFSNAICEGQKVSSLKLEAKVAYDGSYTFMLKWWDMNDPAGPKYDDIPEIAAAGGVGDYLKENFSDIFGGMSPATIEKINQIYAGKALQSLKVKIAVPYQVVNAPTSKTNTATLTTDQGSFTSAATGSMTPSSAVIDAPVDPLTVKMLKTDKESGAALSTGFSFKLQSSNDGGTSWTDVAVDASMLDVGSLNPDGTLTPDANGAIQIKGLTGGMMYRFVEVSHANGYPDVAVDEAHPNDADHTPSANSEAVTVTSQGSGQVITMYNQKAKVDVSGVKTWDDDNDRDGARPASITVNLLRDGMPIDSKTVTPDASGTWAYSFSGLAQYDSTDGHEFDCSITEDPVAGYTTTVAGFDITNAPEPGPAPDPSSSGSKPPASGHQGKSMPATGEGPVLPGILTLAAASLAGLAWAAKKRMRNEGGMQS